MIYFVQDASDNLIKIGTTSRLSVRLRALELEYETKLTVLGVTDGSYADEAALHAKFVLLHEEDEWFKPGRALREFIKNDCRPWGGEDEAGKLRPVKIDREVIRYAKMAAASKGLGLTEYLNQVLTPIAHNDLMEGYALRHEVAKGSK